MSAPFIVPFNFMTVQSSVRTANYTVPAGRYARLTPLADPPISIHLTQSSGHNPTRTPSFIRVNGRNITYPDIEVGVAAATAAVTNTITFSTATDLCGTFLMNYEAGGSASYVMQVLQSGTWNTVVSGEGLFGVSVRRVASYRADCSGIRVTKPSSSTAQAISGSVVSGARSGYVWLRAGDVIAISATTYYLEEFNNIS
jgi:hypothetical protein